MLPAHPGPAVRAPRLSEEQQRKLFADPDMAREYQLAVESMLEAPVDLPWAGCGFDDNVARSVEPYLRVRVARCLAWFRKQEAQLTSGG